MNTIEPPNRTLLSLQNHGIVPVERLNDLLLNGITTGPELALALAFNLISKQDAEVIGLQIQSSQHKEGVLND